MICSKSAHSCVSTLYRYGQGNGFSIGCKSRQFSSHIKARQWRAQLMRDITEHLLARSSLSTNRVDNWATSLPINLARQSPMLITADWLDNRRRSYGACHRSFRPMRCVSVQTEPKTNQHAKQNNEKQTHGKITALQRQNISKTQVRAQLYNGHLPVRQIYSDICPVLGDCGIKDYFSIRHRWIQNSD